MIFGNYNIVALKVIGGFKPSCDFAGTHFRSGKLCPTKQEALDYGIKILEEELQEVLNSLKPKYQMKPKPVDAVQWFPNLVEGIRGSEIEGICGYWKSYKYKSQPIKSGDWIVDGKVVTNELFKRDYEVTT